MILFWFSSFSAMGTSLAKYVPRFRSLTITRSIFAPSARKMFASRSCVSGRSRCVPCIKHRDRHPNALIDEDYEDFFLVAKKYCDAAAGSRHCADLHFDRGSSTPTRMQLIRRPPEQLKAEGIKHRVRASQHFRSFWGAWRTIAGYEAIHMIRKGQAWGSAASSKLNCRVIEMTLADLKRRLLASSDVLDQASNVAVVKTS